MKVEKQEMNINQLAFFELLRAGLWEKEARLSVFDGIDFNEVYRLAEEQSVVGLVAAGMEHVTDVKIPQTTFLFFVGNAIQIEQRNKAMNAFVAELIERLRKADIYVILVKGQGIAQCYERPLWRACGDVDLLLSEANYKKAKALLMSLADSVEDEDEERNHLAMTINGWVVELHGTLRSQLGKRIDNVIDETQNDTFQFGNVRVWQNEKVAVYLPSPNNDMIFVFCHILQHFFRGGIGLRQICDWCRLLYTYKDTLNHNLLESRLSKAGLMSEWKAFAALAVVYLGMPIEVIPFYSDSSRWKRKASRVMDLVLETGNFGNNRDYSYQKKYPYVVYKAISLWRHTKDGLRHFSLFPDVAAREWWRMLKHGIHVASEGK